MPTTPSNEADLLLAFGVRFDDRVTGKVSEFAKHGKIVHIDIDPSEINKNKEAHIPIVSDIKYALAELNKIVEAPDDLGRVARADCRLEEERSVQVRQEFDGISAAARDRRAVEADPAAKTRSSRSASASIRCGRRSTTSSCSRARCFPAPGLGTMGFGLPAAMGAKAAHPDKLVVDIDGDGSFLMNIQELATCLLRKAAGQGAAAQQPAPGHGRAVGRSLPRGNRAHTYLGPDRQSRSDRPRQRPGTVGSAIPISSRSPKASAAAPPA